MKGDGLESRPAGVEPWCGQKTYGESKPAGVGENKINLLEGTALVLLTWGGLQRKAPA